MIYYKRGQYDSAIDQFKKAMQSVDSKEEKQKYQKYILQLANKANNSQEMLNAANDLMKGGENAQILLYKSRALYDMGNYQEAMNAAKRAIEVAEGKQKTSSLYFALGLAAKKAGQIDTAKKAFSKVENGVLSFVAKQEVKSMN
jgi:tetratricopeptide (TPR) repeat protein